MTENKLKELAALLAELEQTLVSLKATEDTGRRRLLLRKMSRLLTEIERTLSDYSGVVTPRDTWVEDRFADTMTLNSTTPQIGRQGIQRPELANRFWR